MIADGLESVWVGGERSAKGVEVTEEDSTTVKVLSATFGVLGAFKSAWGGDGVRATLKVGAVVANAAGAPNTGTVMKAAATTVPKNPFEFAKAMKTASDTQAAVGKLAAGNP